MPDTDATNVKKTNPRHAYLPKGSSGLKVDSNAKTEQIHAIQVSRFIGYYGRLDSEALARIEEAFRITLALR